MSDTIREVGKRMGRHFDRIQEEAEELLAENNRLREERDALAALVQWRPIESAEKYDGEYLLYGPGLIDLDFNPTGVVEGHWQDDTGWVGAVWCGQHDCWHDRVIEPTHFLPKFNPEMLPETRLARLKAQWQAEVLKELYNQYAGCQGMIRRGALLDKATEVQEEGELRRQADIGTTPK